MRTLFIMAQLTAVSVGPGETFRTVASGIAAAAPGAVVTVRRGVYHEPTIIVDRPLTLVGEQGAVLDGEGARGLLILAADDVTIRGLTFRNTGVSFQEDRAALLAQDIQRCRIEHNTFEETLFAVYLAGTTDCAVLANTMVGLHGTESRTGNAVHSWGSRRLLVRDNQISGHRDGIYLEFTRHATVTGNQSVRNLRYGLHFMYADSSSYEGNRFEANGSGVAVMYSKVVALTRNLFVDNRGATAYGLLLKEIADVELHDNRFVNNTTGLMADGADRVRVIANEFDGNGWALRLMASTSDGLIRQNLFRNNTFDVAVNARIQSTEFSGNWWDRYRGWDLDGDGVGDVGHHPVRLFTLFVDRADPVLMLQRSLFVRMLDAVEHALPVLTPKEVIDRSPLMAPPAKRAAAT
ncbi:MAG: nitrous oxide reductase family maturation protein NosD [Gemmatimonadales bacterium]